MIYLHSLLRITLPAVALLSSCATYNLPVATLSDCTRVNELKINKETRAIIDATLILKVDTRRRKYKPEDFCAFNQPTTNGKYHLITIYDKVGNHTSPTWMLMNKDRIVDTNLNDYQMSTDSVRTLDKIIISVTRVPKLDSVSRRELIQMMMEDAHNRYKHRQ